MPFEPFLRDVFPGQPDGGIPDSDTDGIWPEDALTLPWVIDPAVSWLAYACWVEVLLDAGMAMHKPLPQKNPAVDTLGEVGFSDREFAADFATNINGPAVDSVSGHTDIIQRMANSEYRFIVRGGAQRAGYQIPIPGLLAVGGQKAVPEGLQRAYNKIVGNLCGIPIWQAEWELPYVVAKMTTSARYPVPPNPALHISPFAELPVAIVLPRGPVDQRAIQISTLRAVPPSVLMP